MTIHNKMTKWMPGLKYLGAYQRDWLASDVQAGLSVAAVALPIAIAYAELTGVSAVVGLYACVFPMIAYALFGSSRQVIVGPDTATCAVISAVVTPLAAGNPQHQWQLCIVMTLMMGLWCLIAGKLHLGTLADLLSKPILTGLMNGLTIIIIASQLGNVFGFKTVSKEFIENVWQFPQNLMRGSLYTALFSALMLCILIVVRRFYPRWPAPLIAMMVAITLMWGGTLSQYGIMTLDVGVGFDLPIVSWPSFSPGLLRDLVLPSLNLALISFISLMMTARSFAAKNGYSVDADTEFRALGLVNIIAALSQGFAISGTSSRTAVNDANGGKSPLVSIIAALVIGAVVLFGTKPLQYIPLSALGVILIYSSWSLLDFRSIIRLRRRNAPACRLAIFTFISVLLVGVIPGIGLAVLWGFLQFLRTVFRPTEQLLGVSEGGVIQTLGSNPSVAAKEGVLIYRFNSPLTYFNIGYFNRRVAELTRDNSSPVRWVVIDAVTSFTYPDISVISGIDELKRELKPRNIRLVLAGRSMELKRWFSANRAENEEKGLLFVSDLHFALRLIQSCEHARSVDERSQASAVDQ